MEIGMRHLHLTVVIVFLLFLIIKTLLLLSNKLELLNNIRAKTKIVESILGVLILGTGVYMVTLSSSVESYIWVKLVVMLIAIPLGIIGLRKHNKLMAVLSVVLFLYIYGIAEAKSYKFKPDPIELANRDDMGREIYQKLCTDCHGEKGDKGLYKAPDLRTSVLTDEEKKSRILQGKGIMRGYDAELNPEQLDALIEYINQLN